MLPTSWSKLYDLKLTNVDLLKLVIEKQKGGKT